MHQFLCWGSCSGYYSNLKIENLKPSYVKIFFKLIIRNMPQLHSVEPSKFYGNIFGLMVSCFQEPQEAPTISDVLCFNILVCLSQNDLD